MKKVLFGVLLLAEMGCALSGHAAPCRWGIALNHAAKECAGYWPGDEFVAYHLPQGWQGYFPVFDPQTGRTALVTEIGSCDFQGQGDEERCCRQLGYKYVSDNIGKNQKTPLLDREKFLEGLQKGENKEPQ